MSEVDPPKTGDRESKTDMPPELDLKIEEPSDKLINGSHKNEEGKNAEKRNEEEKENLNNCGNEISRDVEDDKNDNNENDISVANGAEKNEEVVGKSSRRKSSDQGESTHLKKEVKESVNGSGKDENEKKKKKKKKKKRGGGGAAGGDENGNKNVQNGEAAAAAPATSSSNDNTKRSDKKNNGSKNEKRNGADKSKKKERKENVQNGENGNNKVPAAADVQIKDKKEENVEGVEEASEKVKDDTELTNGNDVTSATNTENQDSSGKETLVEENSTNEQNAMEATDNTDITNAEGSEDNANIVDVSDNPETVVGSKDDKSKGLEETNSEGTEATKVMNNTDIANLGVEDASEKVKDDTGLTNGDDVTSATNTENQDSSGKETSVEKNSTNDQNATEVTDNMDITSSAEVTDNTQKTNTEGSEDIANIVNDADNTETVVGSPDGKSESLEETNSEGTEATKVSDKTDMANVTGAEETANVASNACSPESVEEAMDNAKTSSAEMNSECKDVAEETNNADITNTTVTEETASVVNDTSKGNDEVASENKDAGDNENVLVEDESNEKRATEVVEGSENANSSTNAIKTDELDSSDGVSRDESNLSDVVVETDKSNAPDNVETNKSNSTDCVETDKSNASDAMKTDKSNISDLENNLNSTDAVEMDKPNVSDAVETDNSNSTDEVKSTNTDNSQRLCTDDSGKEDKIEAAIADNEKVADNSEAQLDIEKAVDNKASMDTQKSDKASECEESVDMKLESDQTENLDVTETVDKTDTKDESPVAKGAKANGVESPAATIAHMTQEQLQQQLQEHHDAMTRLQAHAHQQQVQANLQTTSLRAKLRRRDQELRHVKSFHEQQMSAVLSHLLYIEGQMQKDHREIYAVLQDKEDVIRRQKAAIEDLTLKNERLLQALKESHGYAADNGLVKPDKLVMQQNGNISIQDHGNKVVLRGHKGRNGEKPSGSGRMVRFSMMKDRLRRHKSSLELYQHEPLETLMETTLRYGSEENLQDNSAKNRALDRKERCRSLVDYPYGLGGIDGVTTESPDSCFSDGYQSPIISRNDSTSSLVSFSEKTGRIPGASPSVYGFNELSKSRSVPHALPTVSENDTGSNSLKERPHSLPSVEMLAKDIATTPSTTPTGSKTNLSPSGSPTNSSPPAESNPFKSFKNVFKRKGSKKKKAAAVAQGKEQTDVMKQHFKKFDMT